MILPTPPLHRTQVASKKIGRGLPGRLIGSSGRKKNRARQAVVYGACELGERRRGAGAACMSGKCGCKEKCIEVEHLEKIIIVSYLC